MMTDFRMTLKQSCIYASSFPCKSSEKKGINKVLIFTENHETQWILQKNIRILKDYKNITVLNMLQKHGNISGPRKRRPLKHTANYYSVRPMYYLTPFWGTVVVERCVRK